MLESLLVAIAILIAALLHGLTGMAFPLISTAAVSFLYSLPKTLAIVAFPSLLMSLLVLVTQNKNSIIDELKFYFSKYKWLAITSLIGSIIGIMLIKILPVGIVYFVMAIVTIYYAVNGFLSQTNNKKPSNIPTGQVSMAVFGLLAGIIGGATNAMSPILLMYLFAKTDDKHEISKASNLCYLLSKLVQIFFLRQELAGLTHLEIMALVTLSFVSIGFLLWGVKIRDKVSQSFFKNSVYLILLFMAVKMAYSGVKAFHWV